MWQETQDVSPQDLPPKRTRRRQRPFGTTQTREVERNQANDRGGIASQDLKSMMEVDLYSLFNDIGYTSFLSLIDFGKGIL